MNMLVMTVTLEVSKLSGWLNADAYCQVERRAYGAGRGWGQQTGATASSVQWRLSCRFRADQAWSAPRTSAACL